MRCTIAMASWIAPVIVGASSAIAQQPTTGLAKDTIKKLDAVSIVATPSAEAKHAARTRSASCR